MIVSQEQVNATRFTELSYQRVRAGLWRIIDNQTGNHIGPFYRTKQALLEDLERFARDIYGCN